MMAFQKRVALIAGPTASGKSARALALARQERGVVINADAMQVYGALRILTARPTVDDEAAAPHRLYGHVAAEDAYSAGRWLAAALTEIESAWSAGKLPIVCGGTGLYFMALEKGISAMPAVPEAIRIAVRREIAEEGAVAVHAKLAALDPEAYARLKPRDTQRIARALEVMRATGKPIGDWQADTVPPALLAGAAFIRQFIEHPRDLLYARAERRFDEMITAGALDEVRALPPVDSALPITKAIGLRELQAHLAGHLSLAEAVRDAKTATRHYIKRQLTWWRGQAGWN